MADKDNKQNFYKYPMVFEPLNYKLLAGGLLLVIAGFTAMYLEGEVYGILSLYISPIVIIAGYIVVIFSILVHPSSGHNGEKSSID